MTNTGFVRTKSLVERIKESDVVEMELQLLIKQLSRSEQQDLINYIKITYIESKERRKF